MKNTLFELWRNEIAPSSEPAIKRREERLLCEKLKQTRQDLEKHITPEGLELLDVYEALHRELEFLMSEDGFVKGFSLGVRTTAEAYDKT